MLSFVSELPVWLKFALLLGVGAGLAQLMIRVGVMDMPAGRKNHARPTPTAGGVAVIGACAIAPLLFPVLRDLPMAMALAACCGLGCVGLGDDVRGCGAGWKLLAQIAAAGIVVLGGPWSGQSWGPAGAALAIFWLVLATNAFNFMDGLDGLAGGVGLIGASFLAAIAPAGGATQACALALAAGLGGFLAFNLPPARLFLGDTGSQFCGLMLSSLGLGFVAEQPAPGAIWLLPALLSGVLFDVGLTLLRRWRAGAALMRAHREHLYQRASWPRPAITCLHWGFAGLGGTVWFGLGQSRPGLMLALLTLPQLAWAWLGRDEAACPRQDQRKRRLA